MDPEFPIKEWDCLLPQCDLTLNLLCSARINPHISAYAYMEGNFDDNKTPLVPPGMKVVAHDPTASTWAPPGNEAWTIGPSLDHYRCIKCFFPHTKAERNVKTLTFFPALVQVPKVTTDDFLRQAALDIITILTQPPTHDKITLEAGDETRNALLKIAKT